MYHRMENTLIGNNKSLLPFQKGILKSMVALKMLFNNMELQNNAKYILTYRLNQDPLEMFIISYQTKPMF